MFNFVSCGGLVFGGTSAHPTAAISAALRNARQPTTLLLQLVNLTGYGPFVAQAQSFSNRRAKIVAIQLHNQNARCCCMNKTLGAEEFKPIPIRREEGVLGRL